MPERMLNGEALWNSDKLLQVQPPTYRAELSWLIPLMEATGAFECNPRRVWQKAYSYHRDDWTPQEVAKLLDELERVKLLFRWQHGDGKTYGHFVGALNFLPPRSRQGDYKTTTPPVPLDKLAEFLGRQFVVKERYSPNDPSKKRVGKQKGVATSERTQTVSDPYTIRTDAVRTPNGARPIGVGLGSGMGSGIGSGMGNGFGHAMGMGQAVGHSPNAILPSADHTVDHSHIASENTSSPYEQTKSDHTAILPSADPSPTLLHNHSHTGAACSKEDPAQDNSPEALAGLFANEIRERMEDIGEPLTNLKLPDDYLRYFVPDMKTLLAIYSPAQVRNLIVYANADKWRKYMRRTKNLVDHHAELAKQLKLKPVPVKEEEPEALSAFDDEFETTDEVVASRRFSSKRFREEDEEED